MQESPLKKKEKEKRKDQIRESKEFQPLQQLERRPSNRGARLLPFIVDTLNPQQSGTPDLGGTPHELLYMYQANKENIKLLVYLN